MKNLQLRHKASQVVWYAKRPALYPDLGRHLARVPLRMLPNTHDSADSLRASHDWCESVALSMCAFADAVGIPEQLLSVADEHPDAWAFALKSQADCPVRMGGGADVDLLYTLCLRQKAARVVETGVAYGWSSLAILLAMSKFGDGKLISVDRPYPQRNNDEYVGCVVPKELRSRWTLIRRADRDGLPKALRSLEELDLAHYDSDKSYSGRMFGYSTLWSSLRPGGVLVSDDIGDNLAFRDFANSSNRRPLVVAKAPGQYVGVLVK